MAKAKKATKQPTADASADSAPIADVSHPDTSAPSDTSRPIITHRPMMKDPMVVAAEGKDTDPEMETEPKSYVSQHTTEAKLTPPSETAADTETDQADKAKPEEDPPAEADTQDAKDEAAEADEPDKPDEKPEKTDAKTKRADPDLEAAAQAEQDAKVRKLVESKKYFLPINAVEQRRSARVVAIGAIVAIILAVAWVDVALDAGLIHLGSIKPVTHLFSN